MTEQARFLRAVRAAPDDDAPRLVYADWLDEHGDPDRAEFIRLQCELAAPRAPDEQRAKTLRQREQELLQRHRDAWLGGLAKLADDWAEQTRLRFTRGLVETASLPADVFITHDADVERHCPALREATFFRVRGRGEGLAGCPALGQLTHVEVADWMTGEDARALAASPCLGGVQSLRVWLGSRHDEAVCRELARPKAFPALRQVQLVQIYGGVQAGDRADELRARADDLAAAFNRRRRRKVARVERPFERLFPIAECSSGLFAGQLPGGRQGLFAFQYHGRYVIAALFDAEGNLTDAQERNLVGDLVPAGYEGAWIYHHEQEMRDYLRREFGFQPGLIHVKEFTTDGGLAVFLFHNTDVLEDPDAWAEGPESEDDPYIGPPGLLDWMHSGNFVILFGNDNWAGPDGFIHST